MAVIEVSVEVNVGDGPADAWPVDGFVTVVDCGWDQAEILPSESVTLMRNS